MARKKSASGNVWVMPSSFPVSLSAKAALASIFRREIQQIGSGKSAGIKALNPPVCFTKFS
jgi:hypothetical protein